MRNCLSPPPINRSFTNLWRNSNCDCNCHSTDDCEQDFLTISSPGSNLCFSPSAMRNDIKCDYQSQIKNNFSSCSCEEICNCPCHCVSCVCCSCVKGRQAPDTGDYYRNLYLQIKSELELEKKRNERMKYNKQINETNMDNWQKEKNILCQEIDKLKLKLEDALNKLNDEIQRNKDLEDELNAYKQEEIPKIEECYEQTIKKIKDDANKQIDYLNNQLNSLSKENMELKYKLKKKQDDDKSSMDNLIEKLNNENYDLKNELENKDQILDQLKNENDSLNNQLEEMANRLNQENNNLKNQNLKLNQTIKININEIN